MLRVNWLSATKKCERVFGLENFAKSYWEKVRPSPKLNFENFPESLKNKYYTLNNLVEFGKEVFPTNRYRRKRPGWRRVFSTRSWVILVARTRKEKKEENSVSTFGRFRLYRLIQLYVDDQQLWFIYQF